MSSALVVTEAPLSERMEYAKVLSEALIIPKAFQKRPADILVAVEYGRALGIEPIVALREINVINGTPALSALMMAALAREAGHKVRTTGDSKSATCVIVRKDDPDFDHSATWDEQKARDAGLWGRGHWGKDSGTMLKWRAIAECVRFACPEVLGGLKYSVDEVEDFAPTKHTVTQVDAPAPSGERLGAKGLKAKLTADPEPETASVTVTAEDIAAIDNLDDLRDLYAQVPPVGALRDLITARAEAIKAAAEQAIDETTGEVIDAELIENDPWANQPTTLTEKD